MRRRHRLTTRRPGRPTLYCNFSVRGVRFRGSLETDDEEIAEQLAAEIRAEALHGASGKKAEIPLTKALARYWIEQGQYAATADDIARYGRTLIAGLGAATPLSGIDTNALTAFVASRRVRRARDPDTGAMVLVDRANASINREVEHLRTVMRRAHDWGFAIGEPKWARILLDEPEHVQTVLSAEQEDRFFAELRTDFPPLVEFALTSGLRLENCIRLVWRQIDWDAKTITFRVKSRRPGRKLLVLPLTQTLAAILSTEQARNRGAAPDDVVFTYICARNRHDPHHGIQQVKGLRYPFTASGWRREWARARRAIGLPELRFHDLRHTAGTRAYQASRDLPAVQRMLGHADIDRARLPTWRLWAIGSPFETKDVLKARGYRWNGGEDGRPKSWFIDLVDMEARVAPEIEWLRATIFASAWEPRVDRLTAFDRYREGV